MSKGPSKTSGVWNFFELVHGNSANAQAICHFCDKKPTARRFIRPVATVRGAITKEFSPNADNGGFLSASKQSGVAKLLRVAHLHHNDRQLLRTMVNAFVFDGFSMVEIYAQ